MQYSTEPRAHTQPTQETIIQDFPYANKEETIVESFIINENNKEDNS